MHLYYVVYFVTTCSSSDLILLPFPFLGNFFRTLLDFRCVYCVDVCTMSAVVLEGTYICSVTDLNQRLAHHMFSSALINEKAQEAFTIAHDG